jgi:hypothetical protein
VEEFMPQLPEQVSLKDYIKAMQSAKADAIRTFVTTAEKKLPKELIGKYYDLVRDMIKLFVVSLFMNVPEASQIADILSTKKIMLNDWARYVVLSSYVLPNMATGDVQLKEALHTNAASLQQAIQAIEQFGTKNESLYLYHEGILGNTFAKIKSTMWRATKAVGKGIVMFASQIINVYNATFDTLTYPVRKLLQNTIAGQLISQVASLPLYFLINAYPPVALVAGVHRVLTSPMVKKGAPMVANVVSGKFWEDLNKQLEDVTKDIDMDKVEEELDALDKSEKAETT